MLRWATPELQPKISLQIDATRACFVRTPARYQNASCNPPPCCSQHCFLISRLLGRAQFI